MKEYIVSVDETQAEKYSVLGKYRDILQMAELIRCRNCMFCEEYTNKEKTYYACKKHCDEYGYWEDIDNLNGYCDKAGRKEE